MDRRSQSRRRRRRSGSRARRSSTRARFSCPSFRTSATRRSRSACTRSRIRQRLHARRRRRRPARVQGGAAAAAAADRQPVHGLQGRLAPGGGARRRTRRSNGSGPRSRRRWPSRTRRRIRALLPRRSTAPAAKLHRPQQVQMHRRRQAVEQFTLEPETRAPKIKLPGTLMGDAELAELQIVVDPPFVPQIVTDGASNDPASWASACFTLRRSSIVGDRRLRRPDARQREGRSRELGVRVFHAFVGARRLSRVRAMPATAARHQRSRSPSARSRDVHQTRLSATSCGLSMLEPINRLL